MVRGYGHGENARSDPWGWLWYVPATVAWRNVGASIASAASDTTTGGKVTQTALPPDAAAALAAPPRPTESTIEAAGIPFHVMTWGATGAPPVLLLHGITANARTWWRIGPALAAAGTPGRRSGPARPRRNGALERSSPIPRHCRGSCGVRTRGRARRTRREDRRAQLGRHDGGRNAGGRRRAARLVLVDPPAIPLAMISAMLNDPVERRYDDLRRGDRRDRSDISDVAVRRCRGQGRGPHPVRRARRPRHPDPERRLGRRHRRPGGSGGRWVCRPG